MSDTVQIDPEILGGTPTFRGTRVPVQTLFDYLEAGDSIDDFVEDFPTVNRDLVLELLETMRKEVIRSGKAA